MMFPIHQQRICWQFRQIARQGKARRVRAMRGKARLGRVRSGNLLFYICFFSASPQKIYFFFFFLIINLIASFTTRPSYSFINVLLLHIMQKKMISVCFFLGLVTKYGFNSRNRNVILTSGLHNMLKIIKEFLVKVFLDIFFFGFFVCFSFVFFHFNLIGFSLFYIGLMAI